MNVERPLPTSDQMERGTLEYFLTCRKEHNERFLLLKQKKARRWAAKKKEK